MTLTTMRLFIALNFPASLRDQWHADTAPLRHPDIGVRVRWTPASQMHLTLAFLGEQPSAIVEPLSRALTDVAAGHATLELVVGGVGAFPDWKRARVLWLGVKPSAALDALVSDVAAVCARLSLPGFERRFHPHVTLGRVADGATPRAVRLLEDTASAITTTRPARTDSVDLMASTLAQHGAQHELVAVAPFGAPTRRA